MASFDVYKELNLLKREMDEAFRDAGFSRSFSRGPLLSGFRFPATNVTEDGENLYLEAVIPGVDPKEIEVTALRNTLTISGERKPAVEPRGQTVHRQELASGKFSRTIELPVEIDAENISAQCQDGILRMTVKKAEHAKPRRIEIISK